MRVDIQTDFPLAQSREQMVGNVYPVRGGFGARNGAWESWADEDPTEIASSDLHCMRSDAE
jgi:hypothetical protein